MDIPFFSEVVNSMNFQGKKRKIFLITGMVMAIVVIGFIAIDSGKSSPPSSHGFNDGFESGDFQKWDVVDEKWKITNDSYSGQYAASCLVEGMIDAPNRRLIKRNVCNGTCLIEGYFKTNKLGTTTCSGFYVLGSTRRTPSYLYLMQVIEDGHIGFNQRNKSGRHEFYFPDPLIRTGEWYKFQILYDPYQKEQSVWIDNKFLNTTKIKSFAGEIPPSLVPLSLVFAGGSTWKPGDDPDIVVIDNIHITDLNFSYQRNEFPSWIRGIARFPQPPVFAGNASVTH
jgi:hypothetical protein